MTSKTDKPKDGLEAAAKEAETRTVDVLGETFHVVEKLTVVATHLIYKAQREEDLSLLIDSVSKMIVPAEREKFTELLLDPPADAKEMDMEEFNDLFQGVLEAVVGRPLEQ